METQDDNIKMVLARRRQRMMAKRKKKDDESTSEAEGEEVLPESMESETESTLASPKKRGRGAQEETEEQAVGEEEGVEGEQVSADEVQFEELSASEKKRRGATPGHRGYKKPLPVREHTSIDAETGRRVCVHCGCSLSMNVTRIKIHMLEECMHIPDDTRRQLAAAVAAQTRLGKAKSKRGQMVIKTPGKKAYGPPPKRDDSYLNRSGDRRGNPGMTKQGFGVGKRPSPVWMHTIVVDEVFEKRKCAYCELMVSWRNPTRIKHHLLNFCKKIPKEVRAKLKMLHGEGELGDSGADDEGLEESMGASGPPVPARNYSKGSTNTLFDALGINSYGPPPKRPRVSLRPDVVLYEGDPNNVISQIELGEGDAQGSQAGVSDDLNALVSTLTEGQDQQAIENGTIVAAGVIPGKTKFGVEDIKDYMERLDHLIAGLCRIRTRVCKSILTKHKREGDFTQAVKDLRVVIDKTRRANIID